jgi:hypothetical protein
LQEGAARNRQGHGVHPAFSSLAARAIARRIRT